MILSASIFFRLKAKKVKKTSNKKINQTKSNNSIITQKKQIIKKSNPKSISDPKKNYKGPIFIYYASQSGTASKFAEDLSNLFFSNNYLTFVQNINKFKISQFSLQKNVIFILSTHYDGDPPDNCTDFLKSIKDSTNRKSISNKRFCIFGLGDITYDRFNDFAKKVNHVFTKYESKEVMKIGLGSDHEGNIEQYFDKWKRKCIRAWKKIELPPYKGNIKICLLYTSPSPRD